MTDEGGRTRLGVTRRQAPRLGHVLVAHADHRGHRIALGGHRRTAQGLRLAASPHPLGRSLGLALGIGHVDDPAKPDHVPEAQLLAEKAVELLVPEPTIGHHRHGHPLGQHLAQTSQHRILVVVARILERRLLHRAPHQRDGASLPGDQRGDDAGLPVRIEVGPVERHHRRRALGQDIGHPVLGQCPRLDAAVREQPVDLLHGVLGMQPARQRQPLADGVHRERGAGHGSQRRVGQRIHPLRVQVLTHQVLDKPMHILEPNPRPLRHAALLSALAMSRSMISKRSIINALAISSPYAPINSI